VLDTHSVTTPLPVFPSYEAFYHNNTILVFSDVSYDAVTAGLIGDNLGLQSPLCARGKRVRVQFEQMESGSFGEGSEHKMMVPPLHRGPSMRLECLHHPSGEVHGRTLQPRSFFVWLPCVF